MNTVINNLTYDHRRYTDTQFIVSHCWDVNEPSLLFCEAKSVDRPEKKAIKPSLYPLACKQKKNKLMGSSVCFIIVFTLLIISWYILFCRLYLVCSLLNKKVYKFKILFIVPTNFALY